MIDWRLPEHRVETFQRSYTFHLKHKAHPGMVYSFLPELATEFALDDDGRAWLVWLNGNTQNAVTSLLLLEAAPRPEDWRDAVAFWNDNFKLLEWDTDRRHQKSKFGEATEKWIDHHDLRGASPAEDWMKAGDLGWKHVWEYSKSQPYMGRLSAWSMMEYARILFGSKVIPDTGSWMLEDQSGSQSHRNALCTLMGYDAVYWGPGDADMLGVTQAATEAADVLLSEARRRNPGHPDVSRLTMESALCTWKSWHKPNRRYPGVYADIMYNRICKAEARFGRNLDLLWDIRRRDLPTYLRLEDSPFDPGVAPIKQNHYLETGIPIHLGKDWSDMDDGFLESDNFSLRKDPVWV